MTIHPDVSGRPHVLLMHERLIEHINKHEGVQWVTMAEVSICNVLNAVPAKSSQMCDWFKSKNSPSFGAVMPTSVDEVMKRYKTTN